MERTESTSGAVADRIRQRGSDLTGAERRVAEVVLRSPHEVAFGTVADLARSAAAGAATVVRLATKLGYDGYTDLQAAVQADLVGRLRPAAERIREQTGGDRLAAHLAVETTNLRTTIEAVDPAVLGQAADRLADLARPIMVVAGNTSRGVASQTFDELAILRDGVRMLDGDEVAVRRDLALASGDSTLLAIDIHRYDRWVVDVVDVAVEAGIGVIAVTDSHLSPLAAAAAEPFVVTAGTIGPFDSHVGILGLLSLLVNETAARLADSAGERLDAIEHAWRRARVLSER